MRICVFGAGAVGGHLAAKLAAAGHQVSAFVRGAQLAAIRAKGLVLLHGDERISGKLKASDRSAELGRQDAVIVTMKANVLPAAATALSPLLGPETPVVFAQNGIPWWYAIGLSATKPRPPDLSALDPGGVLRKTITPERILGGVIYSANDLVEPGIVLNHTPGNNMLVIGESDDGDSSRVKELRAALEKAGMSSPPTQEIRCAVWNKAVVNLGTSSVCLLADAALGAVRGNAGLKALLARAAEEARAIARAHGVDPDGAPQRPSGGHGSGNIGHKPSMVHDYDAARPMEIESQFMAPLAFARVAKVATPTLDALAQLSAFKAVAKGLYSPPAVPVQ